MSQIKNDLWWVTLTEASRTILLVIYRFYLWVRRHLFWYILDLYGYSLNISNTCFIMGLSWFASSLQSPNKATCLVSAGRINLFSKTVANFYQSQITELHLLKICNSVTSSQLEKEHNSVFFTRKIYNFLLKILYWKEYKYVLTVVNTQ